jgi:CRP-like cAMP-binding protein
MYISKHLSADVPDLSLLKRFHRKDCLPSLTDEVWQIEKGILRTVTWNPQGQVTTLGLWGQGDVVGEALTRITPYQVECLTPVVAKALPLTNHSQYWRDALLNHLCQTQELFRIIHQGSVTERLMHLLAWLAQRFGQPTPEGQVMESFLTHHELSEIIGTTRVTVTRLLARLESQGKLTRLPKKQKQPTQSNQNYYRNGDIIVPLRCQSNPRSYPEWLV